MAKGSDRVQELLIKEAGLLFMYEFCRSKDIINMYIQGYQILNDGKYEKTEDPGADSMFLIFK